MDVRNYFQYLWRVKWRAIVVGMIFGVCGLLYSITFLTTTYEGFVFLTVGMEQGSYPQDAEAFGARGVTEADNYFAETVQGWTMDPSFANQVSERVGESVSVSARKQERQNLIFQVFAGSSEVAELAARETVAELSERLSSYNDVMKTSYAIANPEVTVYERIPQVLFNVFTGFVLGFLILVFGFLTLEYLRGVVSFGFQVEKIFGKGAVPGNFDIKVFVKVKDEFKISDVQGNNCLVFVKMGMTKEQDLEIISRVAGNIEWTVDG
ncbi:MAG: hypothetical protein ABII07_05015 [Patescibacteria group bacterium]|nr:hypothetical protein [Patescibacteria group bacterium]